MSSTLMFPPDDGHGNQEDLAEATRPTSIPMEREETFSVSPHIERAHEFSSRDFSYEAISGCPQAEFNDSTVHPYGPNSNPQMPGYSPQPIQIWGTGCSFGNSSNGPASWSCFPPAPSIAGEIDDSVNFEKMIFENAGFAINANQVYPNAPFNMTEQLNMLSFSAPTHFDLGNDFRNAPFETFDQSSNTLGTFNFNFNSSQSVPETLPSSNGSPLLSSQQSNAQSTSSEPFYEHNPGTPVELPDSYSDTDANLDESPGKATASLPTVAPNTLSSPVRSRPAQRRPRLLCNINDCTKTFKRKYELQRHQLKHTGVKTYDCKIQFCNRSGTNGFARKDKLTQHMKQVHSDSS